MSDRWTWRVAELPYQYAVEIRGDRLVWIWDSGPGIPPTEEAQPLQALLQQGRAAVPSAWQQIPPPILDQVRARIGQLSGGVPASDATGPTQFAPAITAQVASQSAGAAAPPVHPQGNAPAAPVGWGPPGGGGQAPPPGWGPPQAASAPQPGGASPQGPQAGFGPPQGPPPAAPVSASPSSAVPTTPGGTAPGPGALPTSASLPTAAPVGMAPPSGDPKAQVLAMLRAGDKPRAIELYRQHFKVNAMLAKEEVEYLAQTLKDE